jgi:hypothetical protein
MPRYYIPAGRAFCHGPKVIKPGDPIPSLSSAQIDRLLKDGSLAVHKAPTVSVLERPSPFAPRPEPVDPSEPEPGFEIPHPLPPVKLLPAFLADYDDADHVKALWDADGRQTADRHYKKRLRDL